MNSLRLFLRDWRTAEIRLLIYALVVAVMAVTSVGFFTDRIDTAMRSQATALFGADLVIQSPRPLSDEYVTAAKARGLQTAATIEFPSVVLAGEESLLVQIKAVSSNYPLRGSLETTTDLDKPGSATGDAPAAGQVWVEANVLYRLGASMGDMLNIGQTAFVISRVVTFAADSGGSLFQVAPKVLLPLSQLDETGLLSPGSRASYRFLAAGEANAVESVKEQLKQQLTPAETLQTAEEGRPEINNALDRASRFMGLASILTVVLAGAAVALASLSYTREETTHIAVMKSLGFTRRALAKRYLQRFTTLILVSTALGSALGFGAQFILSNLMAGWIQVELPAASPRPLLAGLITATLTLTGFALPSLLQLLNTPPARILRSEAADHPVNIALIAATTGFATWLFLVWQARDLKLASLVFIGVLVALGVFLLVARLLTSLLRKWSVSGGTGWRLGIRNTGRYRQRSALLIATFGISVLTLMMLSSVRQDLMNAWQASVPEDAPNHFLINIQPGELEAVDGFLSQREAGAYKLYPMIRGRLLAINDQTVSADDYENPRAKRLVSREFNLSATDELPNANTVISGSWDESRDAGDLSVESGIAETLGFSLGDELTFDVAGQRFRRTIGNLREVNWDSMQPNFFVIVPPDVVKDYPATYITSVHVDNDDTRFTAELVRAFPGITVLDVRAILSQVRRIISQASAAVQYVFAFTLLAGIVVLLAAVQTQRHERRREMAVLKTLGAHKGQIMKSVMTEFALIGTLAGLLGGLLAMLSGWALAEQVFGLDYRASFWPLVIAIVTAAALLTALGYRTVGTLINTRPVELLR